MPEENDSPQQPPPEQPTLLGDVAPDEMFARGMQSVKMTSGATSTWQPPTLEEAAQLFPGYEVLRLLGRGGMGAVYQARQIELDRLVAIKLLPLEISVDKDFADRFRREARAMARLNHPHIIAVYDFGTTREGHLFFVMEFVEGANLADIIHQVGLDGDQALSVVEQICTALAYAHGKGIVHRDIKPANVMIDTESHVKVADFGLARLNDPSAEQLGHTMTGTVMGTPGYMAPEQTEGMNVDHRADIYSLGVMLYEMLCRQVPKGIFDPPSHRTGCDARIDQIVIKAMQQAPDRRYQSTQEMKADVTSARMPVEVPEPAADNVAPASRLPPPPTPPKTPATLKAAGASARPKSAPPRPETVVVQAIPRPASGKSRLPLYMGIAAVALVLGALVMFLAPKLQPERAPASGISASFPPPAARSTPPPTLTTAGAPAPGDLAFSGHLYQLIHDARTWDDAEARAEFLGGHLATLSTKEEEDWFSNSFGKQMTNDGSALWLGGISDGKGHPWRWVTGEPWNWDHWHPGEPAQVGGGTAACVLEYVKLGGKLAWRSAARGPKKMFYVVEWDDEKQAQGHVQIFAGHRYQLVSGNFSWDEAKANAEVMGGHLAFVKTKEVHEWIASSVAPEHLKKTFASFWIGGRKSSRQEPWRWTDGSEITDFWWASFQPDVGKSPEQGDFPALLNYQKGPRGEYAFNDSSDTAAPQRHWRNETVGFLVEWDNAGDNASATSTKDAPFVNTLGQEYVPVPGTEVLFGRWDTRVQDYAAYARVKTVDDSWSNNDRNNLLLSRRVSHAASYRTNAIGFRCVLAPSDR